MKCDEIMKRTVHAAGDQDDACVAARLMREHDVGFLPVCDEAGRPVGVVTDRDLALRVCADDKRAAATPLRDIMTVGIIACRPTHSVAHAARQMRSHKITRILITSDEGELLGVVSLSDVAQYVRPAQVGRTVRAVTERKYAPERP
ncbi:CBS domain-containing protein [soil metagenome]